MLVDPATGAPISTPDGTLGGEMGMDALGSLGMGYEQAPLAYDMLAGLPGVATTSAWNMRRVSNTVVKGGTNQRRAMLTGSRIGRRNGLLEGLNQTLNPMRFNRMSTARMVDPSAYGSSRNYSPFNFVAGTGNKAVKFAGDRGIGRPLLARLGNPQNDPTVDAFSRGTFGRMAAMSRIGSMSDATLAKRAGSIMGSVMDIRGETFGGRGAIPGLDTSGMGGSAARASYQGQVGSTIRGSVSGRFAGYFQGAQSARVGNEAAEALLRNSGDSFFNRGAQRGVTAFRGGSTMARFAGSRGAALGLRAAGPIGTIMLVRDLAMLGGKLVGALGKTVMDAGKSLAAPLNKGVMGANFRDNSVAATARQRGVMAIANSRLNMRSVLGHEASAMASYYG